VKELQGILQRNAMIEREMTPLAIREAIKSIARQEARGYDCPYERCFSPLSPCRGCILDEAGKLMLDGVI
jgi:hypothetical protein